MNLRKIKKLTILFALSYLAIVPTVAFSTDIENLHCGTNSFAPFGFREDGILQGIEVELIEEIAQRMNIKIKIELFPWKRLLKNVEIGDLDCMFAAFKTPERQSYMDYTSVPIHVSSLVFFTHKLKPIQYRRLEDLKGLKIGLVRGFTTSPEFDDAAQKKWFTISSVDNFNQNFKMLSEQRVDTVLVNAHVGFYTLKKLGINDVTALPVPLTANSAYVTFSKKKNFTHMIPLFDKVLFDVLTDGTYEKIFRKYQNFSSD